MKKIYIPKGTIIQVKWIEGTILDEALIFRRISDDGQYHEWIAQKRAVAIVDEPKFDEGLITVKHLRFARAARNFPLSDVCFEETIDEDEFARSCERHSIKGFKIPGNVSPLVYPDEIAVTKKLPSGSIHYLVPAEIVKEVTVFARWLRKRRA